MFVCVIDRRKEYWGTGRNVEAMLLCFLCIKFSLCLLSSGEGEKEVEGEGNACE